MDIAVLVALAFKILDAVRPIIEDCVEPTPEGVATVRAFGSRVQTFFKAGLRAEAEEMGLKRMKKWRYIRNGLTELKATIATMTDSEVAEEIRCAHSQCRAIREDLGEIGPA